MKHIFKGITAPSYAPRGIGNHYVNTVTGDMYISKGISSPSDWVLISQSIDDKVKVSATDTTHGYLNNELTVDNGTNTANPLEKSIVNPSADEKLNIRFDQAKLNISQIPNVPAGKITSTNVQGALNELDAKKINRCQAIVLALIFG